MLVARFGTDVPGWAFAALFVVGTGGWGACFGSTYDVTIGDIAPAEAAARPVRWARQQVSNGIGAALVTTVYLQVADGSGAAHATVVSLAVVACVALVCRGVVPLLHAQRPEDHGH
ncbi:hypothetical protein [Streptomyces sp. KL116D]|uniref:hypothetical protein n=1 Tax=Streptomyces sp. KL116D TaxID=3045152 RepID=UPI0035560838